MSALVLNLKLAGWSSLPILKRFGWLAKDRKLAGLNKLRTQWSVLDNLTFSALPPLLLHPPVPALDTRASRVQIRHEYIRYIRDPSGSAIGGSGSNQLVALGVDAAAIVLVFDAPFMGQVPRLSSSRFYS